MKFNRKFLPATIIGLIIVLGSGFYLINSSLRKEHSADAETKKSNKRNRPPRIGNGEKYIVIDRYSNKLYLRTKSRVIFSAECSTGSGTELKDKDTGRQWRFETPSGVFSVTNKLKDPWWRKPDWAFIEEGESIPDREAERYDSEMMGDYAIGFGNGYFIHGTIYEKLLGVSVTHGCVRLGAADLKRLYNSVDTGTTIFIY